MTLKEVKKRIYALIEEYAPDSEYLTEDIDYQNNINLIIDMVNFRLSEIMPISITKELDIEQSNEYVETILPEDMAKRKELWAFDEKGNPQDGLQFHEYGTDKIRIKNDRGWKIVLEYNKYPTQINEETADDFELEIDLKAQYVLIVGVTADILRNDPTSNYVAFESKYQNELVNLDTDKTDTQFIL